jgi:hypothetical protein
MLTADAGRDLIVGIRPEHFEDAAPGGSDQVVARLTL